MKLLAHNSKPLHGSPRSAPVRPAPDPIPNFAPSFTPSSTIESCSHTLTDLFLPLRADSRQLQHLSLAPVNLHKTRVRRASAFSDRFFERAPQSSIPLHSDHQGRVSEKALA